MTLEPCEIWSKTAPMLSALFFEMPFGGIGDGGGLSKEGRGGVEADRMLWMGKRLRIWTLSGQS